MAMPMKADRLGCLAPGQCSNCFLSPNFPRSDRFRHLAGNAAIVEEQYAGAAPGSAWKRFTDAAHSYLSPLASRNNRLRFNNSLLSLAHSCLAR
jgi:hypothetical protein